MPANDCFGERTGFLHERPGLNRQWKFTMEITVKPRGWISHFSRFFVLAFLATAL